MISLIACVDINLGIGNGNNDLLFDLPADRRYFRQQTKKSIVVMGRKTWESLPKKPLDQRENYVLTRDKEFVAEGAIVIHSIEEVLELGKGKKEVFIMGGEEIYKQFMPHAQKMYLTHVHTINIEARRFFPDYGIEQWKYINSVVHKADKKHAHRFAFATYERIAEDEVKEETN